MVPALRTAGDFCWFNMLTPEPAKARAFFGELLGWTYSELPGVGHVVKVGGRDVGGLFDVVSPRTPKGTASRIAPMVKVDDADATAKRVNALGGRADDPFDVFIAGRLAVFRDPNGAELDAWQAKAMKGTDVDTTLHGAPSWFETPTSNVARAAAFYTEVFGWTARLTAIPGVEYLVFENRGEPIAGTMSWRRILGSTKPAWDTYFSVDDVEEAARTASRLGATLGVPVQDIPTVGRFCGIVSPQGVPFYAIEYA